MDGYFKSREKHPRKPGWFKCHCCAQWHAPKDRAAGNGCYCKRCHTDASAKYKGIHPLTRSDA